MRKIAARLAAMAVVGFARALTGVLPAWRGCLPATRQRVYFANHTSHGDFVLVWTVLPAAIRQRTRPVAARDYWGGGLRRFIAREVFDAVLVDRRPAEAGGDAIAVLAAALDEGASLILFPEGTRQLHRRAAAVQERPSSPGPASARCRVRSGVDRQRVARDAEGRDPAGSPAVRRHLRRTAQYRSGRGQADLPRAGARRPLALKPAER